MIERVPTGVEGFDQLVDGGFPKGHFILVSGETGCGKTTFAFQYLYGGAKNGEPGIFISFEEKAEHIIEHMENLGLADVRELVEKKMLKIVRTSVFNFNELKNGIRNLVEEYKAKRLVLYSSATLALFFENPYQIRMGVTELINFLRPLDCTVVLTSEIVEIGTYSRHSMEEFLADGVILLYHKMIGNTFVRAVSVVKMRGTKHSEIAHPIGFDAGGIKVFTEETLPEGFI
jgi:circadian clock protein KaiC